MPPKSKSTTELLRALTKEELLELINSRFLFWNVTRSQILLAKIAVIQKKADAHFEKYLSMKLPDATGNGLKNTIAFYTALEAKQKQHELYDKCHKRIDKLFKEIENLRDK
jgi:hypothetical protein